MSGLLELDAGLQELVPGVRELVVARLLEPVGAPVHQLADVAERDGLPLAVDHHGFLRRLVPAAGFLADLGGDVAHVDELVVEQEGPVEADRGHVGAAGILRRGGDAGQQAADADHLVVHLDAGRLLVGRGQLVLEEGVVGRHERAFVHHCEALRLGPGDARAEQGAGGAVRGKLKDVSTRLTGSRDHTQSPLCLLIAKLSQGAWRPPPLARYLQRESCPLWRFAAEAAWKTSKRPTVLSLRRPNWRFNQIVNARAPLLVVSTGTIRSAASS